MYDEAPTRWSDIDITLPAEYEVVPTTDPDHNLSTIFVDPPPTSTLKKTSPDYANIANIPDVVPLSARSRTNASSPNLMDHSTNFDFNEEDCSRTNPSTPRGAKEMMERCQSQHLSENNIDRGYDHDDNYSKSQEDMISRGVVEGSGNSSTFPPVAPCRRKMKKTLYSRISQRWGSEDWEKDESFLAMLAVRLNRMQSRPEITEL